MIRAALLAALIALAAAPSSAAACACCPEPGEWSHLLRRATAEELAEVGRINFGTEARVYVTAAGLDGVRGIAQPSLRYTVRHRRPHREWTLELANDHGSRGSLRFVIPDTLEAYRVDLDHGERETATLYKEWRFSGPLTARGDFRGTRFRLVLQGRGTACPDVEQLRSWVLQVTGGGADYALFGALASPDARLGVMPSLYFASPPEAVRIITELVRREDWVTLTRYYDLDGSDIPRDALTSGRFFVHAERPAMAHPGLPWKYRHPFTPGFTFAEARATPAADVVTVVVTIAVDEGGGRMRRGVSEFRLRKSAEGYRVLPD